MTANAQTLLDACWFPVAGTRVSLAVSGGPDSVGLLLLALDAELEIEVHHVDHHTRATSTDDAGFVRTLCASLDVACVVHDVEVDVGANFEARARAERRRVLPDGVLTGHTMDDLAETVVLNMLRGAGVDGLSPMVDDATKPLRDLRRADLHGYVAAKGVRPVHDETNDDLSFRRNRVRHQLLPLMCEVADRDVVPVLARQASVLFEERSWLNELGAVDLERDLDESIVANYAPGHARAFGDGCAPNSSRLTRWASTIHPVRPKSTERSQSSLAMRLPPN